MEPVGPALVLLAKLLLMEPGGTRVLSEYRASIPTGGSGLIRDALHEERFPGAFSVSITPRAIETTAATDAGVQDAPKGWVLLLRSELWDEATRRSQGRPPDETNVETVELSPGVSRLVQLAEDLETSRRLVLSLNTPSPDEVRAPAAAEIAPREIAFRVDAFRDRAGVRDLVSTHILRTLTGRPVSCESSRREVGPGSQDGKAPSEDLLLTLVPGSPQGGWITVEADLSAKLLPAAEGGEPQLLNSKASRTVSLGLPFEVSVAVPPSQGAPPQDGPARPESYVVQITPYIP